jgi:hypothetical protein
MQTVNLSKALKIKNRLAGELARLQTIFSRENSRRNDTTSKVDRGSVLAEIENMRADILSVKTAIAKANVGIYEQIARMEELKAYKKFINSLNTKEGEELRNLGRREYVWDEDEDLKERKKIVYVWDAYTTQEDVDRINKEIQSEMDKTQDSIDEYNATHKVDLEIRFSETR